MEQEIKKKNTKKIVIIIISVIIIAMLVIGSIVGFVGYNIYQVAKLTQETNYIVGNIDLTKDTIDTEDIKTSGDYAKVEKAIKSYLNEAAVNMQNLLAVIDNEKLANILSVNNYKNDGPEFNETITYIQETIRKLDENTLPVLRYLEAEEMYNYIEKEDLSEYYKELYKTLMIDGETQQELEQVKLELDESITELKSVLNKSLEIINFLKENSDDWVIEGNKLMFYSQQSLNKYNQLVNEL